MIVAPKMEQRSGYKATESGNTLLKNLKMYLIQYLSQLQILTLTFLYQQTDHSLSTDDHLLHY